jgi:hypothetical protein
MAPLANPIAFDDTSDSLKGAAGQQLIGLRVMHSQVK